MESKIEIPQITKASVDYALTLPKEYSPEMIVSHRKGFEAGAKWQRGKIEELIKCLKDAADSCKERNLNREAANYWLGAENAYLQVIKSCKREFEL